MFHFGTGSFQTRCKGCYTLRCERCCTSSTATQCVIGHVHTHTHTERICPEIITFAYVCAWRNGVSRVRRRRRRANNAQRMPSSHDQPCTLAARTTVDPPAAAASVCHRAHSIDCRALAIMQFHVIISDFMRVPCACYSTVVFL